MPRKVPLGRRGEVEFPLVTAGLLEDHEEAMRTLLAFSAKKDPDPFPLGKDMAAVVTVTHAALQGVIPDLTRDEVRGAITAASSWLFVAAITEAFGFEVAQPGEAVTPAP